MKSELKTKETTASVAKFIEGVAPTQREDAQAIVNLFERVTGEEPKMWGTAIIGFGYELLKYESGRELDWFKVGFSPRKANHTLYGLNPALQKHPELAEKLGKYTTSKGCLYIKKLSDIDVETLGKLIKLAA